MLRKNIMHSSGKTLALTLLGLCTLSLAARPASAQNLVYQLAGVTFNDGAVASGYFDFNPTTNSFGDFDITTTNGVTDTLIGAEYKPGFYTPSQFGPGSYSVFQFISNDGHYNSLVLVTQFGSPATAPGTTPLAPGEVTSTGFSDSGEFAPISNLGTARAITSGSLIVTDANPVPEASTTVSFGLLLALGMGGLGVAAKKKKASASA